MVTCSQSGSHTVIQGQDLVLKAVLPGIRGSLTLIERPGGPQRGPHRPPATAIASPFWNSFLCVAWGEQHVLIALMNAR